NGKSKLMYQEDNKYYIDITDDFRFLKNNAGFIWASDQDGFAHIYLYGMDGKQLRLLTPGNYDVVTVLGVDEKNNTMYYQASAKTPLEKEVYSVSLDGNNKKLITDKAGMNSVQFSTTYDLWVWTHSTANSPPTIGVYDRGGKLVRMLEENKSLQKLQGECQVQPVKFFDFTTSEGVKLNGYTILPYHFDPTRKYPVFMHLYGGPGSQEVVDGWMGNDYWWFQSMAQQGYIIACVDNRGTGGRGEEFRKMTYLQLGHYETIDQIEAAKYLGRLPYADSTRIGIFGWSYGGYMSSLCLLKGNEVFNSAIAVAPVTNWKWYDSIYTERYMRDEKENKAGYEDNSPVNFADRLKGNYLLVHGGSDDNVHFQNSMEMAAALIR
ncbi:MAG TPA: alpha/beta fold hydrolase, partial [Saprospiraceae bacterium]|nr:alpha/beta fold hydrolase [Saprospiraceae bacterium]